MRFLPQERRRELIASLTSLGMPPHIAETCASYSHDLVALDQALSRIINRLGERCHRIRQATYAGDEQTRREQDAYLKADLYVFSAYRDEVTARKLPARLFPRINRSIALTLAEIEANKTAILQVVGRQGAILQ